MATRETRRPAGATGWDGGAARRRLVAGMPVAERRIEAAGVPTAVLEGGDGPPIVLLHGPGESAVNWRWVVPDLCARWRVIAPDLPAHAASGLPADGGTLDAARATAWLGALIERTCDRPPALVGHVLGGAIAARHASAAGDRIARLVLVDSLGLARFRPSPAFAAGLVAFMARPGERSHERFMKQCAYDLGSLRARMGAEWEVFAAHKLEQARSPQAAGMRALIRRAGVPRIPPAELSRIAAPTALIWGRHDRANRLAVARAASARHGWPLHVVEGAADDPARDRPDAFLRALDAALAPAARRVDRAEGHGGREPEPDRVATAS